MKFKIDHGEYFSSEELARFIAGILPKEKPLPALPSEDFERICLASNNFRNYPQSVRIAEELFSIMATLAQRGVIERTVVFNTSRITPILFGRLSHYECLAKKDYALKFYHDSITPVTELAVLGYRTPEASGGFAIRRLMGARIETLDMDSTDVIREGGLVAATKHLLRMGPWNAWISDGKETHKINYNPKLMDETSQ